MAKITNTAVYGLDEAIYRSGYPMMTEPPTPEEFDKQVKMIYADRFTGDYTNPHIKRAIKLANAKGGGHDQFLTGITVTMDMTFSNKAWVEAERYTFLNFISSMSTMHRIAKMDLKDACNYYVDSRAIRYAEELQVWYKNVQADPDVSDEDKLEAYRALLYNLPSGFELTASMVTNYRCLKNIYAQRRTHRLPDWQVFCDWVEQLPMAGELITGKGGV